MATNHTTNYQLCQWEATDKVLRTDFNQDNQKIDAALAGLRDRGLLVPLKTVVTTQSNQSSITLDVSNITWADWQHVALDWYLPSGAGTSCYLDVVGYSSYMYYFGNSSSLEHLASLGVSNGKWGGRTIFHCLGSGGTRLGCMTIGEGFSVGTSQAKVSQVAALKLTPGLSSGRFGPGCEFALYGVK